MWARKRKITVYALYSNLFGCYIYVGITGDLRSRIISHTSAMLGDRHPNPYMNEYGNLHGITDLSFEVLAERKSKEGWHEYMDLERKFINKLKPAFNIA